ncbi:hypothetical protein [Neodiprion abietis nucleopolyhedrovirus]|uniref:Uncharacterized protein n=1 Tax=Neodiprion abietis nucleopolyhedrovirus TaxID=204507 RepID=Q0ZP53_9CBAC|nr:hypothetical protein [Neodiprion abietis nucleopolyhedrovirus]ABC74901.1 unknown [Neodiprion abietis nucleopolyhedrovirus]
MSVSTNRFGKRRYSEISCAATIPTYNNTETLMSQATLERLNNLLNIAKHETALINDLQTLYESYSITQISEYFTILTSHVRAKKLSECKKQRLDTFHIEISDSLYREKTIFEMSEFLVKMSNEIQQLTEKKFVDNVCTHEFGTQLKELFDWILATDEFLDKIYIENKFLPQLQKIVDTKIDALLSKNERNNTENTENNNDKSDLRNDRNNTENTQNNNDNSETLQNVFVRHYDNTPIINFVDQLLSMFHEAARDNIISVYRTLPHESKIVAKKHIAIDVYEYLKILQYELSQEHINADKLFEYTTKLISSLEITTIYLDQKSNDHITSFLKSMINSDKICHDKRLKAILMKATCSADQQ